MNEFSEIVYEHINNSKNAGMIDNADGIGELGDPDCGDFLRIFVKISDDIIRDIKYQIHGYPASIAFASEMTELVIGQNIDNAIMIKEEVIINALDGLSENKQHCSYPGAAALKKAVLNYMDKNWKIK